MEKYYITTAIAYASKKPHFGNTYEAIMTDAMARYKRQMGVYRNEAETQV